MDPELLDAVYLATRGTLVMAWLAAAAGYARHAMALPPGRQAQSLAVTALLVLAALLSAHEGYDTAVRQAGKPIRPWSWLWTGFDGLAPVFSMLLLRALRQRDAMLVQLAALAVTDALTGLPNRRGFQKRAGPALAATRRRGGPAAVLMLDLDRFKAVNDGFGHAAGDAVLQGAAAALTGSLRTGDVAARLGGEEFVVLLPDTDIPAARQAAERLRSAIRAGVPHPAGPGAMVTASIGVAPVDEGEPKAALAAALAAADAALYRAKQAGRDRVEAAGPEAAAVALAAG